MVENIFESGELQEAVVVSILENTTEHGVIAGKTQTTRSEKGQIYFLRMHREMNRVLGREMGIRFGVILTEAGFACGK